MSVKGCVAMAEVSVIIPVYNLEGHLGEMLESLAHQSFEDYEAIIVDDGSEDASSSIALRFVARDSRFRLVRQENMGVSEARNRGLDEATGKYLIFFDGDDYVYEHALEKMHEVIDGDECDMAVGIMETFSDGKAEANKGSENLAGKKHIDPRDAAFIKTWSQCNKMYRRDFITKSGARFIKARAAEDGHFLYQVLSKKPKICGCDTLIYRYIRRPFWEGEHTASKKAGREYLEDRLMVYEDMLQIVEKLFDDDQEKARYRQQLIGRFVEGGILQAFYKRIWRTGEDFEDELSKALRKYCGYMDGDRFETLCSKQWEIPVREIVNRRVNSFREYVREKPLISVVIADDLEYNDLEFVVEGLYNQEFPSFEILLKEKHLKLLDENLKRQENIHALPEQENTLNEYIEHCQGEFVALIDFPAAFSTHGLKRMAGKLRNNQKCDFVSAYIKGVSLDEEKTEGGGLYYNLPLSEAIFGYTNRRSRINELDSILSNKLFRKDSICSFSFSSSNGESIKKIYEKMTFKKIRNVWVMAQISDQELMKRSAGGASRITVASHRFINRMLNTLVERAKEVYKGIGDW